MARNASGRLEAIAEDLWRGLQLGTEQRDQRPGQLKAEPLLALALALAVGRPVPAWSTAGLPKSLIPN
jgi:hypothetical protein